MVDDGGYRSVCAGKSPGGSGGVAVVGYIRSRDADGDSRLSPPDALLDAWLLRAFPGRTLEELDAMDWTRYQRAMDAAEIEHIERARQRFLAGQCEDSAVNWPAVLRHDEWINRHE